MLGRECFIFVAFGFREPVPWPWRPAAGRFYIGSKHDLTPPRRPWQYREMAKFAVLSVLVATTLAGCGQRDCVRACRGRAEDGGAAAAGDGVHDCRVGAGQCVDVSWCGGRTHSRRDLRGGRCAIRDGHRRIAGDADPVGTSSPHVVKSVNIVVTPEAAAKVTGDASRFTADALLDAITTELKSRKLLDEQNPQASGTAEIVVDELATRPTSNVILFGYKMLAGTLAGDIRVTGSTGNESTGSRIVAQSKLTLAATGDDKNPLGPLIAASPCSRPTSSPALTPNRRTQAGSRVSEL